MTRTTRPRRNRELICLLSSLALLLAIVGSAAAYTTPGTGVVWTGDDLVSNSGGVVSWDATLSRYVSNEAITVAASDSLILLSDMHFNLPDPNDTIDEDLLVLGSLRIGSPDSAATDSIYLTGETGGDGPGGIEVEDGGLVHLLRVVMEGGGAGGNDDAINVINGNVIVDGCRFGFWEHAVIDGFEGNLDVRNSFFHDNQSYIITANVSTDAVIVGCTMVRNNQGYPGSARNPISVGTQGSSTVLVDSCHIVGTAGNVHGGVSVWNISGSSQSLTVKNSTIEDCSFGITANGDGAELRVVGCTLLNNTAGGNPMGGGSGVAVYGGAVAYIARTTMSGNYWGITLPSGSPTVVLGDTDSDDPDAIGLNSFSDNGNGGATWALYNNTAEPVMAEMNDWGSSDPTEIAEWIYDSDDDPSKGSVDWLPFLSGDGAPIIISTTPSNAQLTSFNGETLLFTAEVYDTDTPADSITWSWLVDGSPMGAGNDSLLLTLDESLSGNFAVQLTVSDPAGGVDSTQWTVTNGGDVPEPLINSTTPPTGPLSTDPGETVAFNVNASSLVGGALTYTYYLDSTLVAESAATSLTFDDEGLFELRCVVTDTAFASAPSSEAVWEVLVGDNAVGDDDSALPQELALAAHPNPFNSRSTVRFALPAAGAARLELFTITGRLVVRMELGELPAGQHQRSLLADHLASGNYLLRLSVGQRSLAQRVTLLR